MYVRLWPFFILKEICQLYDVGWKKEPITENPQEGMYLTQGPIDRGFYDHKPLFEPVHMYVASHIMCAYHHNYNRKLWWGFNLGKYFKVAKFKMHACLWCWAFRSPNLKSHQCQMIGNSPKLPAIQYDLPPPLLRHWSSSRQHSWVNLSSVVTQRWSLTLSKCSMKPLRTPNPSWEPCQWKELPSYTMWVAI